uniref:beta family protein n=1 Tax=Pararhizobium sp. IMCC3301 TaxID=3067904 RepID=UPI0027403D72|nr:hypothetical protein [Pararhizobium sp. IMCC3301]
MIELSEQTYAAVLRLKKGEGEAVGEIATEVADHLLPIWIVPPPDDLEKGLLVDGSATDAVYPLGCSVGKYWPQRSCLLDPRFLVRKLGATEATSWLPALFRAALSKGAKPVPTADLRTLEGDALKGFAQVAVDYTGSMAIRLRAADLERSDVTSRIHRVLRELVLKPSDCFLIMDFENLVALQPDDIALILAANFQRVMEIGLWGQVIWVSTTYPEANPAQPGKMLKLPRVEWDAWVEAGNQDRDLRRMLMFGDYAADSAKFSFGGGGVQPHRQYRYSTSSKWLLARGPETGTVKQAMKSVATRIVDSGGFAGETFSRGDRDIYNLSKGIGGPGRPCDWRKTNTVHHLTRVTSDQASLFGFEVSRLVPQPDQVQVDLPL